MPSSKKGKSLVQTKLFCLYYSINSLNTSNLQLDLFLTMFFIALACNRQASCILLSVLDRESDIGKKSLKM